MNDVVIIGAAMTPFGPAPDSTVRSMATTVCREALDDAGLAPQAVDLVVFANAAGGLYDGQEMIRGQVALRETALFGSAILNVENACASSASALNIGCMAIASGMAETVLVIGAEKLHQQSKQRTFAMLGGAVDLGEQDGIRHLLHSVVLDGLAPDEPKRGAPDQSPFMAMYAQRTNAYMQATGATDADIAMVAVKNRGHATLNPKAQFRSPVTLDQVLASRMIADPLRLLMCSPIADGAAALVLTSSARADRLDVPSVRVRASVVRSGGEDRAAPVARAAEAAYVQASLGPADMDIIEVHDAAASAELWCYEELRLCEPGDGRRLIASGHVALGGAQPVNTSGGLLAKGHPIGATGCAQVVELVDQLRDRAGDRQVPGCRVGMAENGGGIIDGREAVAVITIVSRD
jgi:acetyl-CoA acetyltransferase